jgi:beta-N-acetylhexosaminidase
MPAAPSRRPILVALALALHALIGLAGLFWASHLRDPHLLPMRSWEAPLLLGVALVFLAISLILLRQRKIWRSIFLALWLIVLSLVGYSEYSFRAAQHFALNASGEDAQRLREIGRHLVIGYDKVEDIRELARRGFIAGIFVTRRNAVGKDLTSLRDEIAGLQAMRRAAGLAPLLVTTDQEGGPISRLSPPLPLQPALASVVTAGLTADELERRSEAYGAEQGAALASLGINVDFSPVVDLKPEEATGALDFHTRIATRAIAADPETVTRVALGYSRGLLANGIRPTLKHFPGLGSVKGDTHHFSATLDAPRDLLESRDWRPFQTILAQTPALLMVGHVGLTSIDPDLPASISAKVIDGLLRRDWHHEGLLITDDMTMGAVYNRGLCDSSTRSLAAGMDLLLVSYDWQQIFPLLRCLHDAEQDGRLKALAASDARLARLP